MPSSATMHPHMPKKERSGRRANNTGSIYTKDGKHVARVSVWTSQGRKRPERTFASKAEAEAWIRHMLTTNPLDFDVSRVTVGEYVRHWLEDAAKPSIAPATYTNYEQHVRLRIAPHLGRIQLKALSATHVRAWTKQLSQGLAPGTVRVALAVLGIAMNQAASDGLIKKNPTATVKAPRGKPEQMSCLTEEEAERLIEVARGTKYEAYYLVALKVGLRQGELAALFWSDIDFGKNTMSVSKSVYIYHGEPVWGTTKTGEERKVTLGPGVVEALKRHKKMQQEEKLACPYPWQDERLVFPNDHGGVRTRSTVRWAFEKDLEAAGIEHIRFHDLRDTCASMALGLGTPVHVVAQMLGHKDPAITLRRYAHVLPSMNEMAASRMDSLPF